MSFERLSPIFPVCDIRAAVSHYRNLGFDVREYEGDYPYAFASAGDVEIHLTQVGDLVPASNMSAVYLYVDDADVLADRWSNVEGRLHPPVDTEYGLREGAHVDLDGNLIRFGSPLTEPDV